jgi:hypothetical protein
MIAGMIIVITIIPKISEQYLLQGIKIMPSVFIIGGIGILLIGSYILTKARRFKKYEFFE